MTSPKGRPWKGQRVRCVDRRSSSVTCSRTARHCPCSRSSHPRTSSALPGHTTFSRERAPSPNEWSSTMDHQKPRCHVSHARSEEHTSELQSPCNLVCRLLLEK